MEIGSGVVVFSEDPAQQELAQWAVARFERAGLDAPTVQIRFHADRAGCGGHLGYARDGRVDVCTVLVNEMARRNLLHEMGHIWIDQNVSGHEARTVPRPPRPVLMELINRPVGRAGL